MVNFVLDVAVGIIRNQQGEILLSQRRANVHQGGLWEFAGGKLEEGENAQTALRRELEEELGIYVKSLTPFKRIIHQYPDLKVCLHVFQVTHFSGYVRNCEGQTLRWVKPDELKCYDFPKANEAIVNILSLPRYYAILDDSEPALLVSRLETLLNNDIRLIQARLKRLPLSKVMEFIDFAQTRCRQAGAYLLLNTSSSAPIPIRTDGLHLSSDKLWSLTEKPQGYRYVSASCHNLAELALAEQLEMDFVVLAPVLPTPTHMGSPTLGWDTFQQLTTHCVIPVYALGGITKNDLQLALTKGAYGIAGIRCFIND